MAPEWNVPLAVSVSYATPGDRGGQPVGLPENWKAAATAGPRSRVMRTKATPKNIAGLQSFRVFYLLSVWGFGGGGGSRDQKMENPSGHRSPVPRYSRRRPASAIQTGRLQTLDSQPPGST